MNAFIRVVEAGSFTAAASQMNLATAQVSRLIAELETRLQAKLLLRTTRRLTLTVAGEGYLDRCRQILELMAQAEGEAGGGTNAPVGTLRVKSMAAFGRRYVEPLVSKFCLRHPQVTVEYSTSQNMPDLVADGVNACVYLSQHLPDSSLVAQRLGTIYGIACAAPGYVERRGLPAGPEELGDHVCLRLVNPSVTRQWELTDGKSSHMLDVTGPLVGETPEVVVNAALQGVGIALLPAYAVVDGLRSGALVRVLGAYRSPEIGVYALYASRRYLDATTRAWLDLLNQDLPAALARDQEVLDKAAWGALVRAHS